MPVDVKEFGADFLGAEGPYRDLVRGARTKLDVAVTLPSEVFDDPAARRMLQAMPGLIPKRTKDMARIKQETAKSERGYPKGNLIRIKALAPLLGIRGDD